MSQFLSLAVLFTMVIFSSILKNQTSAEVISDVLPYTHTHRQTHTLTQTYTCTHSLTHTDMDTHMHTLCGLFIAQKNISFVVTMGHL